MTSTANSPTATTRTAGPTLQPEIVTRPFARYVLALARIVTGLYFLWAFVDKLLGLGFSTPSANAWINGGTPAQGYIGNVAVNGPIGPFFELFNNPFGDVLFMAALLGIGVALVFGAGLKVAAVSGALLLLFMDLASPPWALEGATNPLIDSHVLEGFLVILPALTLAGDTWGLGRWWSTVVGDSWLR
jgi:thiosulfate dehydrogenase [quinone] large subunit